MLFVLCRDPLEPGRPDRAFSDEIAALERLGLSFVLIDHGALVRGEDAAWVVRWIPDRAEPCAAIYRGWMVTPAQYQSLYDALGALNIRLINDADQYRHCHYLPECYSVIESETPRTVWLTGDLSSDQVMRALVPFGYGPVVVKDFVKSRKHEWAEACFIPDGTLIGLGDAELLARCVAARGRGGTGEEVGCDYGGGWGRGRGFGGWGLRVSAGKPAGPVARLAARVPGVAEQAFLPLAFAADAFNVGPVRGKNIPNLLQPCEGMASLIETWRNTHGDVG